MTKLTIKLRQHTPIIHFQHERSYATIRATELKPKLDKFLKSKNEIYNLGLPFNDQGSLDYKTRIFSKRPNIYDFTDRFPLYFGNIGKEYPERKKFVYCNEPVEIEFMSYDPNTISAIKSYCQEFFMRTNFGTRQSKGFGSFSLEFMENSLINEIFPLKYRFTVCSDYEIPGIWKDLMEYICFLYNTLRGGVNLPHVPFYFKSMMFLYFKEKHGKQWDKKSIKEAYYSSLLDKQKKKHTDVDGPVIFGSKIQDEELNLLVKDLLGLSCSEKWRYDTITKNHDLHEEDDKIKRFKSQIYFKPIKTSKGYDVWFDAEDIPDYYFNKVFKIQQNDRGHLKLKTPDNFDIHEYIRFAIKQNLANHVETQYQQNGNNGKWYYDEICRIYKEISDNIRGEK